MLKSFLKCFMRKENFFQKGEFKGKVKWEGKVKERQTNRKKIRLTYPKRDRDRERWKDMYGFVVLSVIIFSTCHFRNKHL